MMFELVSIEDAGRHTGDYMITLQRKSSWLLRCFGIRDRPVAFYGHDTEWHSVDGTRVGRRMEEILSRIWRDQRPHESRCRTAADAASTHPTETTACDIVQVASEGSFPASDPPAWTLGRES